MSRPHPTEDIEPEAIAHLRGDEPHRRNRHLQGNRIRRHDDERHR